MKKQASFEITALVNSVKNKHHLPRLQDAKIVVALSDSKPFIRGSFNLGKAKKFSSKIWLADTYDFELVLCDTAFNDVLETDLQREAYIDLLLSCCQVEFLPEMEEKNGQKPKPVKDKWGRTVYSNVIKYDEAGDPKWKVSPLDLPTYQENVSRYGCWFDSLLNLRNAIKDCSVNVSEERFDISF